MRADSFALNSRAYLDFANESTPKLPKLLLQRLEQRPAYLRACEQ